VCSGQNNEGEATLEGSSAHSSASRLQLKNYLPGSMIVKIESICSKPSGIKEGILVIQLTSMWYIPAATVRN